MLDDLKAGAVKAYFDDPWVQSTYSECAKHYGFLLAACRPRPPEHKGKVERGGVHYVKRNFLGGRTRYEISPVLVTTGAAAWHDTLAQVWICARSASTEMLTLASPAMSKTNIQDIPRQ